MTITNRHGHQLYTAADAVGACRPSTLARSTRPPKQSKATALAHFCVKRVHAGKVSCMSRWKSTSVLSTTCARRGLARCTSTAALRCRAAASCAVARCASDSISCRLHGAFQKTMRAAHESTRSAAWHAARQTALHRRILHVALMYSIRCARKSRHGTARARARGVTADLTGTRRSERRVVAADGVRSRRRGRGASRCAASGRRSCTRGCARTP
jgi:hypothetical protein